ncbi:MAG: hypothetical protein H6741_17245 [Alphaproteobacteria bacterium]|nr:hypothetical protein [Alphaproteobacteria bacterium]MCB9794463.1 hypothetical protein [Alphaproteobacteria bacterium]
MSAPKQTSLFAAPPRPPAGLRPVGVRVKLRGEAPGGPERVDQAFLLGAAVRDRFDGVSRVELTINANRRRVLSWRRQGETLLLSVHHQALGAPAEVLAVVAERDARAWATLLQRFEAAPAPRRGPSLDPSGAVHDLSALLAEVDRGLLEGRFHQDPELEVGWGRWPRVAPSRGLRLGSCGGQPPRIRVHPSLDHASVPSWFVGFVLYHELLHLVVPPERGAGGRRSVHPPAFRALERRHPRFEDAQAWEAQHIHALLRRTVAAVRRRA